MRITKAEMVERIRKEVRKYGSMVAAAKAWGVSQPRVHRILSNGTPGDLVPLKLKFRRVKTEDSYESV